MQFLDNLSKLQSDVIAWCNKQNRRKDNYGLIDLYNTVKNAYVYAFTANNIYVKTKDQLYEKNSYFDKSIQSLKAFGYELTSLLNSKAFTIKDSRVGRWCQYANSSTRQMRSIQQSDVRRFNSASHSTYVKAKSIDLNNLPLI